LLLRLLRNPQVWSELSTPAGRAFSLGRRKVLTRAARGPLKRLARLARAQERMGCPSRRWAKTACFRR
jgi:hypothetical protein